MRKTHGCEVHWRASLDSPSQIWNTESCSFSPSPAVWESIQPVTRRKGQPPFHSHTIVFEYKTKAHSCDSWRLTQVERRSPFKASSAFTESWKTFLSYQHRHQLLRLCWDGTDHFFVSSAKTNIYLCVGSDLSCSFFFVLKITFQFFTKAFCTMLGVFGTIMPFFFFFNKFLQLHLAC